MWIGQTCESAHFQIWFEIGEHMEIWDVYDENGEKTGKTMLRNEDPAPGDYYLAVHMWIRNSMGEYLIQKRADDRPLWPGMWAATGGAVLSGEGSMEAALRELGEELGLKPEPGRMSFVKRVRRNNSFADIWLIEQDFSLDEVTMQEEEVSDVRWATAAEIKAMIDKGEFVNYSYLDLLFS
jgi:8-oxo-dGTP diphosphatase